MPASLAAYAASKSSLKTEGYLSGFLLLGIFAEGAKGVLGDSKNSSNLCPGSWGILTFVNDISSVYKAIRLQLYGGKFL